MTNCRWYIGLKNSVYIGKDIKLDFIWSIQPGQLSASTKSHYDFVQWSRELSWSFKMKITEGNAQLCRELRQAVLYLCYFLSLYCSKSLYTTRDKQGHVTSPLCLFFSWYIRILSQPQTKWSITFVPFRRCTEVTLALAHWDQLLHSCFTISCSFTSFLATSWLVTSNHINTCIKRDRYNLLLMLLMFLVLFI